MIFSGGTFLTPRLEPEPNQPSTMYLHFFEGKEKNKIYCDYYGYDDQFGRI